MNVVQPIKDKDTIKDILRFLYEWDKKYHIMFLFSIRTGLRIGDVLKLKVGDLKEADGTIRTHIVTKENKTSKRKRIKLHKELRKALSIYLEDKEDHWYLVQSNKKDKFKEPKPISRQRAWEVMKRAANFVGLNEIGCHSCRKTFGYNYYKQTNDIALLMHIFNHSSQDITLRYIGITDERIDRAFDNLKF